MSEADTLRSMVLSFRMSELHTLLVYAGKSKSGRKTEIQSRALDLVKVNSADIKLKIKELSNAMYKSLGTAASINPYSSNYPGSSSAASPTPASSEPSPRPPTPESPPSSPAPKEKRKEKSKGRGADQEDEDDEESAKEKPKGKAKPKKKPPAKERIIIPPDTSPAMGRSRRTAALVASASLSNLYRESEKDFERDLIEREEEAEKLANASRATRKSNKASTAPGSTATTTATTTTASSGKSTAVTNATTPSTATAAAASSTGLPLGMLSPPPAHQQHHSSSTLDSIISALSSAAALATTTTSTATAPSTVFPSSQSSSSGSSIPTASVAPSISTNPYLPPVHRGITGYINANGRPTSLVQSMYSSMPGYNSHSSSVRQESSLTYPPMPDVKLLKLPFYKVLSVLMKPSALQPSGSARFQEQKFSFYLSPHQAGEILDSGFRDSSGRLDYKRQIQMRFSLLETSCEQDDNFPASICVKVNHKLQPLPNPIPTNKPGVEPKRPPKPINITQLCKLSATLANYIDVSWAVEIGRGYTVSVYYVDKLTTRDLMKELRDRGTRHPDFTRALIKEKLNDKDSDIATTSCKVTLACPLGKMRMSYPCRSNTCDHLQCFDANLYVMMNERRPKWLCPVCNKTALYDNLLIDGYFTEILKSKRLPSDDHEIVLHNDGTWDPLPPPKKDNGEESSGSSGPRKTVAEKIQASVSSSSSSESASNGTNGGGANSSGGSQKGKVETFSVDDDDEEEASKAAEGKKDELNGNNSNAGEEGAPQPKADKKRPIDCITLDSESESDSSDPPVGIPATKRARPTAFLDDDDEDSEPAVPTPPEAAAAKTVTPSTATAAAKPAAAKKADDIICIDDD